ncbi:hypothetical protein [Corynebacterium riegelii]|uniref:hypothetical protein n=1 Tax=Corynebacterium riegelii TaxID=156976 RepID=UPI0023F67B1B|nr:hypothetical protein [Corynebacterium riegelii]
MDTRDLSHKELGQLQEQYRVLDTSIIFAEACWSELKYYERQWLRAEAAARMSREAVLVGRSAARMHGMWVISTADEPVELCLLSRGSSPSRRNRKGIMFRRMVLREDETSLRDGHRVTNGFRTFADIARHHGFIEGLVAADYLRRRGFTRALLEQEAWLLGRLKGIAVVRECIRHCVDDSDSPYESFARALLIQAGIGPLFTQFEVAGRYADLCVDGWLLIEIDGNVKYQGPNAERARQEEFERQKRIANRGYVFLRYSPDFLRRYPEEFVREVRETIAGRRAALE